MRYLAFGKWLMIGMIMQGCMQAVPVSVSTATAPQQPTSSPTTLATKAVTATLQAQLPTLSAVQPSATATLESLPTTVQPTFTPTIEPTIIPSNIPIPATATLAPLAPTLVPPASPIVATEAPTLVPPTPNEPPASSFQYVFPIQPARLASFGSCHHDYPASDIFAPFGSEFVAVTSGVIDFVSYSDQWDATTDDPALRGGLSIALIGDDGIRYYGSHLSAIADGIGVGNRVELGQVLGWVGQSGNAASTPAHLHFGISYPSSPDDWQIRRGTLNPVPYLNDWRNGLNTTPDPSQDLGGAC